MGQRRLQREAWALARAQHGVLARRQLIALGYNSDAIHHRLERGRLHSIHRGVYAVGRAGLTRHGTWIAAVLACGPGAVLSHTSAAALWRMIGDGDGEIHVSVPAGGYRRRSGIAVHRRTRLPSEEVTEEHGIPVTRPAATLIDLATLLFGDALEAAVNEADRRELVDPNALRAALGAVSPRPGVASLRRLLDRRTFTLTDSALERRFLPLARLAGLPIPRTQQWLNGFRVDFFWPELGLVVETDGLRYHRTPAQQSRDRLRDQAHAAAGFTVLRFTHEQVRYEPDHVRATLVRTAAQLRRRSPG